MLDIKEIKKILKEGKDVVVVGRDGNLHHVTEWVVEGGAYKLKVGVGTFINERNFDKFHMIDGLREDGSVINKNNPTFNDLIDVAVQAYKDGVLSKVELRDDEINLTKLGVISSDRGSSVFQDAISDTNSLYTETFVIESEEDMRKMRIESKGVLPNGLEFKVTDTAVKMFDGENDLAITVNFNGMDHNELLYLSPLKGATVTQKRGK